MQIIAHRGASGYAPENTLAAFKKAIEMGAKAVEFDVQMTKDGQLVVIHDYFLKRTTNGSGMIMMTDYHKISKLSAGKWFGEEFKHERVPLLEEVLSILPKDMEIHLEIKKVSIEIRPIEAKIMDLLQKFNVVDRVVFSSFDHKCLLKLMKIAPIRAGVLLDCALVNPVNYLESSGLLSYSLNQSGDFIDQEFVQVIHQCGLKVLSYTINDPEVAHYFDTIGVDGIFSNYPDIMKK